MTRLANAKRRAFSRLILDQDAVSSLNGLIKNPMIVATKLTGIVTQRIKNPVLDLVAKKSIADINASCDPQSA